MFDSSLYCNAGIDCHTITTKTSVFVLYPEGVDIVLDPLGGADNTKGFGLLKPLGKLVLYGKLH